MSVSLSRVGALEPLETTPLTTADPTTIHTASSDYRRVIEFILLANIDTANNCEVTLRWLDEAATATVFWQGDITAGETKILEIPIVTDGKGTVRSLTADAENANDINVTVISSVQARQNAA